MKAVQARCPRIALAVWLGRWRVIKDVPQQAGRYHPEAPATSGVFGWCMTSSADQLMSRFLRQHRFRGVRSGSVVSVENMDPDSRWSRANGWITPRRSVHPMWMGRGNQIAVHAKEKAPRAFRIGRQSRVSKLLLRSRFCLLGRGSRFSSGLCLGRHRCCNSRRNLQCSALITQRVDFCSDLVFALGQLGDVCRQFGNGLGCLGHGCLFGGGFRSGLWCLRGSRYFLCCRCSLGSHFLRSCHLYSYFVIWRIYFCQASIVLNILMLWNLRVVYGD